MNERQLRGVIRQILHEQKSRRTLLEYGDDGDGDGGALYKAFVSPFVDVLQATKLASQGILNSIKLVFKTLITLSPKKLVEARNDYTKVKDTLDKEWGPLMKKARDSVENSDFGLVTFAVAPNLFFGYQLAKFGADAPGTVVDYFEGAGWDVPLGEWIRKTPDERDSSGRGGGGRDDDESEGGIMKSLRTFFFGEGVSSKIGPDGRLLSEAEEDEKKQDKSGLSKSNINEKINEYFAETGFDKTLDDLADQFVKAKQNHADKLVAASKQQTDTLKAFAAAKDIPEFEKVIESSKKLGADVSEIQKKIDELKRDITKKSEDLLEDPKFKEDIKKKAKGKELSDADMKKATENAAAKAAEEAIGELKKSVSDALKESFDQIKKQIRDELTDDMPDQKSPFYKAFAASPRGKEILAIVDKAVNSVGPTGG